MLKIKNSKEKERDQASHHGEGVICTKVKRREEGSLEGIYQKSILGQNRKEQGPEDARVPEEE